MNLQSIGRAPLAGKTSILVQFPKFAVIFDCGGTSEDRIKLKETLRVPVYLILSHTHEDHVLSLSNILEVEPLEKIFATEMTKMLLLYSAEDTENHLVYPSILGVEYYQKILIEDNIYFILTPAGHSPGSAAINLFKGDESLLIFTGDMELIRHFSEYSAHLRDAPYLIVDSSFSFLLRAPMAWKSMNEALLELYNIPVVHPENAEGMAQETTTRLQLFMHKLDKESKLQVDFERCLAVNSIVRQYGQGTHFGDILGGTEALSSFTTGPMISVPTQLESGSTASSLAINCSEASIMMHYDMCLSGDGFRLFFNLVNWFQVGEKIFKGQMEHLKMWSDEHLDFRDICQLVDECSPFQLFMEHALRSNELHNARSVLEQVFPFVTFKELKDYDSGNIHVLGGIPLNINSKIAVERTLIKCGIEELICKIEAYGILMDKAGDYYECGRLIAYPLQGDNQSFLISTPDIEVDAMINELKGKYQRTQQPEESG